MKKNRILVLIFLISVLTVSLPGISEAVSVGLSDYTGYRTADPSDSDHYGIYGTDVWGNASGGYFEISWVIDYNISYPAPYKYEYTFDIPDPVGLSHFIIEVSEDTTGDDFGIDPGDNLKVHNVGHMLPDLFGIKTITSGQPGTQTYIIYSNRLPMWGDLYASGFSATGGEVYAYNFGFGNEPTPTDSPYKNWIPVPNTVIPEPATILLIGTGLVGLVGFRKKLKK